MTTQPEDIELQQREEYSNMDDNNNDDINHDNKNHLEHSKKDSPYVNLKIKTTFLKQLRCQDQIYFGCIAPFRGDHIDVTCNTLKDIQLTYCCGLFMDIDSSFTVYPILSTEFMTSLQKLSLSQPLDEPLHKEELMENKRMCTPNQHLVIYIPGHQYFENESSGMESILNECLHFYVSLPYLVIPFIWPSEGSLIEDDNCEVAEQYCANEFSHFIRRLWATYEWIDLIGHGRGCNILLRALQILQRDKPDVINDSHVICIAPDMDCKKFDKHVQTLRNTVKRMTLYTNTWDWKLYSSKWWNWSSARAGASIMLEKGLDTIDTTDLVAGWATSNHYYLTNEYFQKDISQALSKYGGLDPKYRNYLLPLNYQSSSMFSNPTQNKNNYYALVSSAYQKPKYDEEQENNKNQNTINNNINNINNNNNNDNDNDNDNDDNRRSNVNSENIDKSYMQTVNEE